VSYGVNANAPQTFDVGPPLLACGARIKQFVTLRLDGFAVKNAVVNPIEHRFADRNERLLKFQAVAHDELRPRRAKPSAGRLHGFPEMCNN